MQLPSGRQFVLRSGDQEAVVTEVGGTLRTYTVGAVQVLDGFGPDQRSDGGRGQTLLPWPNRVADGRFRWRGEEHQLALTEPEQHNAIHGLTRWLSWQVREQHADGVLLHCQLPAQPGWPFLLSCALRYSLDASGLTVTTTVANDGPTDAPVATGAHPYLSAGDALVDQCTLTLPAGLWLPTDHRGIPTGAETVTGTGWDLRSADLIGARRLDTCFTALRRDQSAPQGQGGLGAERTTVLLGRPDGVVTALWAGAGYDFLQVYTGDTLAPARRRRALAVEPMTAPPNALASGQGLTVLAPGAQARYRWGVHLVDAG